MKAAVVMIGYSRAWTLERSLKRLSLSNGVLGHDCYLFLDAPYRPEDRDKCENVYRVAMEAKKNTLPHLNVIRRKHNYGVPRNLIQAVNETFERYDRVIFFEDDVCVSTTFLDYMDAALDCYEKDQSVFCINGFKNPVIKVPRNYPYSVYATPRNRAWGFGIWKDRWMKVDFDMKDWPSFKQNPANLMILDQVGHDLYSMCESVFAKRLHTWDVQCTYYMVKNGLMSIEPIYSLTKNIGWDAEGVHCNKVNYILTFMNYYNFAPTPLPDDLAYNNRILNQFCDEFIPRSVFKRKARGLFARLFHQRKMTCDPV